MSNSESKTPFWKKLLVQEATSMSDRQSANIADKQHVQAKEDVATLSKDKDSDERSRVLKKRLKTAIGRWRAKPDDNSESKKETAHYPELNKTDVAKTLTGAGFRLMKAINYVLAVGVVARETGQEAGFVPDVSQVEAVNHLLRLPETVAGAEVHLLQKAVDLLSVPWPADAVLQLQAAVQDTLVNIQTTSGPEAVPYLLLAGVLSAWTGGKLLRNAHRRYEYSQAAGEEVQDKIGNFERSVSSHFEEYELRINRNVRKSSFSESDINWATDQLSDQRVTDFLNYAEKLGYERRVREIRNRLNTMASSTPVVQAGQSRGWN